MIQKYDHDCGCVVTVYGDNSAPPDIEYCEQHGLLALASDVSDYNLRHIAERIAHMSERERRLLRAAISTLDELLDADVFDRHLKRD